MTEKDKIIKVNIISKNAGIVDSFLKKINAILIEKKNIGLDFAVLLFRDTRMQFWITNDIEKRNVYFNGTKTILYIYDDKKIAGNELISLKKRINSFKNGLNQKIQLIFVGYSDISIEEFRKYLIGQIFNYNKFV